MSKRREGILDGTYTLTPFMWIILGHDCLVQKRYVPKTTKTQESIPVISDPVKLA